MGEYLSICSISSFLDDSFRKNLESALRFGNPLLVQVSHASYALSPVTEFKTYRDTKVKRSLL